MEYARKAAQLSGAKTKIIKVKRQARRHSTVPVAISNTINDNDTYFRQKNISYLTLTVRFKLRSDTRC